MSQLATAGSLTKRFTITAGAWVQQSNPYQTPVLVDLVATNSLRRTPFEGVMATEGVAS